MKILVTVKQDKRGVRHEIKQKKITFKTFKKWAFKENFSAETDEQGMLCH